MLPSTPEPEAYNAQLYPAISCLIGGYYLGEIRVRFKLNQVQTKLSQTQLHILALVE